MSFEIGKKCEGLHEGRWYVCTILACEKDGYSVTFDGWSRKFDTVLAPEFVRTRSTIDSRKRKPWTPSINFNKLLPDDEISIDVEGSRKQALVRVVDPFREQLTVECESVQLTVAFRDVLPSPVFTPVVKRKRPAAPRVVTPSEPAPTPPQVPTPVSYTAPQFMAIVRPDGTEIGCGDLVNLSPNAADVVFLVLEVYQEQMSGDLLMNAQKCQLSHGVAVRSSSNFRLTCPVSEVYKLQNPKFSPQLKKEVLEVRQRSILRFSQSLQLNASNRSYQLQARRNDIAAKLRQEIQKGMSLKAARTFTIRLGPADLRHDLELLGLAIENSFKVEKPKNRLADLDPLLGKNWDIKLKQDDRFFYITSTEIALEMPSRTLLVKIKFAESTCPFRQDSYREDTAADCC